MIKIQKKFSFVTAIAVLLTLSIGASAQDQGPPNWFQIRTVNLHADGAAQWVDLQKQLVEAHKDEGEHRQAWEVTHGGMNTFHILSFHQNLAELDEQALTAPLVEDQANWVSSITPTIESRSLRLSRYHPDLSIPAEEGATNNLAVLRHHYVRSGQHQAFQAWVENELKPVMIEAGVTGMHFSRTAFGGDNSVWTSSNATDNWAELDQPNPIAGLSADQRAELLGPYYEMVSHSEINVLHYRADLSY